MKKYNTFSSLATSLGVTISLFFSYFLYNKLEFFWLIVFNMLTYIISGFLYFSLKTSKESAIFHKSEFNKKTNLKKHKILSWIYILAGSAIIGFFTFPKTQGLTQIFDFMKNDYNVETWGFYISLIFSVFGILGTIITLMLLKTKRLKTKKTLVEYSLCAIILLSLILVIVFFANSKNEVMFFTFVSIVSLHQLLFSIFLSYFYSNSYEMFDQKSFHKQNGYSIVFRVVLSSILFVLFTLSSKQLDYRYTFVFYAALLLLFTSLIIISTFLRRRYKKVETEQKKEII
nr:MFS transporter [Mycoplasmopsis columbinasalis]